mgnify:CR=1 FL=1
MFGVLLILQKVIRTRYIRRREKKQNKQQKRIIRPYLLIFLIFGHKVGCFCVIGIEFVEMFVILFDFFYITMVR